MFSLLLSTSFPHHLSFQVHFCSLIWNHPFLKWEGLTFELTISPIATNISLMSALQLRMLRTSGHLHHLCPDRQGTLLVKLAEWAAEPAATDLQTPGHSWEVAFSWGRNRTEEFHVSDNCREPQKLSKPVGVNGTENYAWGPIQKEADL